MVPLNGHRLECYRQAFLPATAFGRIIRSFVLTNVGYFDFNKSLRFLEIPVLNYDLILQNLGIAQKYLYTTKNNFIENICESINKIKQ